MRISDWSSDVCSSDLFGIEVDGERLFEVDGDLRAGLDIDGRERLPVQLVHPVRHVAHATGQDAAHGLVARDADAADGTVGADVGRSEEHTSEIQSLMRISYAVFCLKKKTILKDEKYYKQTRQ